MGTATRTGCGPAAPARAPAVARIRPSKAGRWRAYVLLGVHLLIAVHVAHWWSTGRTLSPLEPSEAMEFSKHSVINAGAIFFALTIASTLVLGRWFCGWACHVVALQDACRWLLVKLGMRPRAIDLGPLSAVPWVAFVYMFVSPIVWRIVTAEPLAPVETALSTEAFWRTFPAAWVALLTFLVCGFLIIVFLGSKGFCTYGCPYGGIFGVVDQFAPLRIRVTDACNGCGHCTAVCTSNVNVRREVHEYGMVVDPGCMKCLDCVSSCPTDALYFGAGRPAVFARARASEKPRADRGLGRFALRAAFVAALFVTFLGYNGDAGAYSNLTALLEPRLLVLLAVLIGGSVLVLLALRPRVPRPHPLTLAEEALVSGAFVLAVLALRGLGNAVPFLLALGCAAILSYVVLLASRLATRPQVQLQRWPLKIGGRLTRAGVAFTLAFLALAAGWTRAGAAQIELMRGVTARQDHADPAHAAARAEYNRGVEAAQAGRLDEAIAAFQNALAQDATFREARENLAGMLCAVGRFPEGIAHYEQSLVEAPDDADTRALLARALAATGQLDGAAAHLEHAVTVAPGRAELWAALAEVAAARGDAARAAAAARRARELSIPR